MVVYGRLRVGKSALLKESLRKVRYTSIYYTCKEISEYHNITSLTDLIAEIYPDVPRNSSSIEFVLKFLFQKALSEPIILVLDEYPYLRHAVLGMDSILQALLDRFEESSKLIVILCGSFISTMKTLFSVYNPLYGRIKSLIYLKPFDYYDITQFYPENSNEDKVTLYSVFDGIPYYNMLINQQESVYENIIRLLIEPGSYLENEISQYLQLELSQIEHANAVFSTMARGIVKFDAILFESHINDKELLESILPQLLNIEIIRQEYPINTESTKKNTYYFINDNLSLFYFNYIFRYSSQREILPSERFFNKYIRDDFIEKFIPKRFE